MSRREVTGKYAVKNCDKDAQSGTKINMEEIIYSTNQSKNQVPNSRV
jgi:hypothetical protein